jgi:hypothetical protein
VVKVAGFSLIRPKTKATENDKNTVETSKPENKEEEFDAIIEDKNDQSESYFEPTGERVEDEEPIAKIQEKQQSEVNIPKTELGRSTVDEMKVITNRPKEKINCENCERTYGTPVFMYDYSEGSRNLVGCCPYCSQIIGKPPAKKVKETENIIDPAVDKLSRLQEKAKKKESLAFHISSDDLDELIKNTAYVR